VKIWVVSDQHSDIAAWVCNPRGYGLEGTNSYRPDFVIEI